jgi:hypothetical protein
MSLLTFVQNVSDDIRYSCINIAKYRLIFGQKVKNDKSNLRQKYNNISKLAPKIPLDSSFAEAYDLDC